jgi:hypothetical protein
MKCLTLYQPYATLIMLGAKQIETRSWTTRYRGRLGIHAGMSFHAATRLLCREEPFCSTLAQAGYHSLDDLPRGVLLGSVELVDVIQMSKLPEGVPDSREIKFGFYFPERYAWILRNPTPLVVPLPMKGQRSLYDVTLEIGQQCPLLAPLNSERPEE